MTFHAVPNDYPLKTKSSLKMPPRVFPFIVTLYTQPLKSGEKPSCRETLRAI